jgi:hypothetical protein
MDVVGRRGLISPRSGRNGTLPTQGQNHSVSSDAEVLGQLGPRLTGQIQP